MSKTLETLEHNISEDNIDMGWLTSTKSATLWRGAVRFEAQITPLSTTESAIHIKAYTTNKLGTVVPFSSKKPVQKSLDDLWLVFERMVQRSRIQDGG